MLGEASHTTRMLTRSRWTASRLLRKVADRIQPWDFLDARQAELGKIDAVGVETVLRAYLAAKPDFTFVLIGANAGDEADPLSRTIRELGLRGILVEPQAHAFARLQANYADQQQVVLERAAIASRDGTVTLHQARSDFWERHGFPGVADEVASLDREHVRHHIMLFGGAALAADEAAWGQSEEVPALTLTTLLARHGFTGFDYLQIDAEGFDYEILKMVDWAMHAPQIIHFETVHLTEADRVAAWALLRGHGYVLHAPNSYNTLAIRAADNRRPSR